MITNAENGSIKELEGEWLDNQFQFESKVKVTIKDKNGEVISSFEGKVDANYNPILN